MPINDNLSLKTSRLRDITIENFEEDIDLYYKGIIDHASLISGYIEHNHPVELLVHDKNGTLKFIRRTHNLRTNQGGHDEALALTSGVAGGQYIALSNTAFTPNSTDTTLQGEITVNGLSRILSTFTLTSDPAVVNTSQVSTVQGQYKIVGYWTATAPLNNIQACGVFSAITGGDLWFEALFGAVSVNTSDSLTLSYLINF